MLRAQFFLMNRAIYVLVWRVVASGATDDDEAVKQQVSVMITDWMEALQLRVPGAHVVLVATHIDCAPPHEVDRQVVVVQELVKAKMLAMMQAEEATGIPALTVLRGGASFCVDCLHGVGVAEVRKAIIAEAIHPPWCKEVIPAGIVQLQARIENKNTTTSWISWDRLVELACSSSFEMRTTRNSCTTPR